MYSNALRQNPLFKSKIAYKQGREEYSTGTVTKPCQWDAVPKQVHRTKYLEQRKTIHANTQLTVEQHVTPKVYELDSTLPQKKFGDIDKNEENCHESTEKRFVGRTFPILSIIQNNVAIETSKPIVLKEHVGGSSDDYPTTKIGETLIKQKALNFLANDFPESLSKLNKKLAMCLSIQTKGTPTPTPTISSPPSPQMKSKLNTSARTKGYEIPMDVKTEVEQTTPTTSNEYEGRSAEEVEDENYKQILGKLSRIKSRVSRNLTSDISQTTINYLRSLKIIEPEDTDKLNIIAKIDDAITQLENHFDTRQAQTQDV